MPKFTFTNNRRGPWTLIRATAKNIDLASGKSVTVEMDEDEAKNAGYPGVDIAKGEAEAKPAKSAKKGGDDFDRKDYMARADKLELEYKGNISNDELKTLVDEAEAKPAKGDE